MDSIWNMVTVNKILNLEYGDSQQNIEFSDSLHCGDSLPVYKNRLLIDKI
jgi:hypothetical protein